MGGAGTHSLSGLHTYGTAQSSIFEHDVLQAPKATMHRKGEQLNGMRSAREHVAPFSEHVTSMAPWIPSVKHSEVESVHSLSQHTPSTQKVSSGQPAVSLPTSQ